MNVEKIKKEVLKMMKEIPYHDEHLKSGIKKMIGCNACKLIERLKERR